MTSQIINPNHLKENNSSIGIYVKGVFKANDLDSLNLKDLYQRILAYHTFNERMNNIVTNNHEKIQSYDFLHDGLVQLKLKADLKQYFNVLTEENFYTLLKSIRLTIVFFYLPCKCTIKKALKV